MRQNVFQYFILLLCFGLSGLSFDYVYTQEASKPKPVKVDTPQRGKIERKITYTGNLEADAMVNIFANIPGKLTVLNVNEGDQVNTGDVLAETDARELHLALKQAASGVKGGGSTGVNNQGDRTNQDRSSSGDCSRLS